MNFKALGTRLKFLLPLTSQSGGKIPKSLHQTWKQASLPPTLRELRNHWKALHPAWKHRFWTDEKNRELIRMHYPWFLPVYDRYPQDIQRADAFRYFLLYHFGGVYVDVDFEALKAIDPLLEGRTFLLGLEPERHEKQHGREQILCNALMASTPKHPFLRFVLKRLLLTKDRRDVLESTGPFFLSECYKAYSKKNQITLLDPEVFYPLDSDHYTLLQSREPGSAHPFGEKTYAIHYWQGSNWRTRRKEAPVSLFAGKTELFAGNLNITATLARRGTGPLPLVSCLMITGKRPGQAACAVECFLRQTYPNLELLILDEGNSDILEQEIAEIKDPRIRYFRLKTEKQKVLGELRQQSVELARGEYICQWDDDDLSGPERVEVQMAAIFEFNADASFISRIRLWWPLQERLAVSGSHPWEGTMICRKEIMPKFPALSIAEDTPVMLGVIRKGKVVQVGEPELYTYTYHGTNTYQSGHFDRIWSKAEQLCEGKRYPLEYHLLNQEIPMVRYSKACDFPVPGNPVGTLRLVAPQKRGTRKKRMSARLQHPSLSTDLPSVLVLTPMRNVEAHLDNYFNLLAGLDYPAEKLSLGILEGDSTDATPGLLPKKMEEYEYLFCRSGLVNKDFNFEYEGKRWDPGLQKERRSMLARCRNFLLHEMLEDEQWVLWMDADLADYPADSLHCLLKTKKDIVVPCCCRLKNNQVFDMNTFIWSDPLKKDSPEDLIDGVYQPTPGEGRRYLDSFAGREMVEVDSVGGTMLLVRADLHREGLVFPAAPYRGYLETEGLAMMAKDWGFSAWGIPDLKIRHVDF